MEYVVLLKQMKASFISEHNEHSKMLRGLNICMSSM